MHIEDLIRQSCSLIRCSYCDLPYDAIGKLETFVEDLLYISHVTGVQLRRDLWYNRSSKSGTSNQERTLRCG